MTPTPRLSQSRLALMKAKMTEWILANPELVEVGIAKLRENDLEALAKGQEWEG